jgi:hypothetical protein
MKFLGSDTQAIAAMVTSLGHESAGVKRAATWRGA